MSASGEAWACPSCGLMITDGEAHQRASGCRRRAAEKCPHCGLMKLRNVEHHCSVYLAIQKNSYAFLKARARSQQRGLSKTETIS